ncbi:MAG: HEAT repeat domain-containing protein [Candidatus Sericytochromatia bacterium]
MGLLDFLFKKKTVQVIDYDKSIEKSWDLFRKGFQHPNPAIRRASEDSVWYVDTPDGKRFFSVGMQDPDLDNKLFCLKKIYERGGWRLSETVLKIAYNLEEDLTEEQRIDLISFFGDFSDPTAADFMEVGLENASYKIRLATIFSICGTKSTEKMKPILNHYEKVSDDFEKYACLLALWQFNHADKKSLLDNIIESNITNENYIEKLKYLELGKAKQYLEKISANGNKKVKLLAIDMINDNRGLDILKNLIKDDDINVAQKAIEKITEIGSRSALDNIKEQEKNKDLSETVELALAIFGDKDFIKKYEDKAKNISLSEELIILINKIALFPEQNVSEIINTHLVKYEKLDELNEEILLKINQLIKILIKYGKISSIDVLEKYLSLDSLEKEEVLKWQIANNAASAILCILERNTTYYTLRMKEKDNLK